MDLSNLAIRNGLMWTNAKEGELIKFAIEFKSDSYASDVVKRFWKSYFLAYT